MTKRPATGTSVDQRASGDRGAARGRGAWGPGTLGPQNAGVPWQSQNDDTRRAGPRRWAGQKNAQPNKKNDRGATPCPADAVFSNMGFSVPVGRLGVLAPAQKAGRPTPSVGTGNSMRSGRARPENLRAIDDTQEERGSAAATAVLAHSRCLAPHIRGGTDRRGAAGRGVLLVCRGQRAGSRAAPGGGRRIPSRTRGDVMQSALRFSFNACAFVRRASASRTWDSARVGAGFAATGCFERFLSGPGPSCPGEKDLGGLAAPGG